MSCAHCVRKATEALQAVPGVAAVAVDLDTRQAAVRWGKAVQPDTAALCAALRAAGYKGRPVIAARASSDTAPARRWWLNLWVGLAATAPMLIGEWLLGLGAQRSFQWLSFLLAAVVQVVAGSQFYRGAWRQLRAGRSNMDTLVALGSTTAFAYSLWTLLGRRGGHLYFMEAAAILTLVSLGHWLEARVSARATDALRGLMQLAPATAKRLSGTPAGENQAESGVVEEEVPVEQLRPGDRVLLRPGDRVPVDGTVEEGGSAVDEAMLTGESTPVDKSPGDPVYAGTTNLNGRLVMRVTATGRTTALAQIVAAVQRAQSSRANIQRLADRVSAVFVPAVVLVALVAGLLWGLWPEVARRMHDGMAPLLWAAHPPTGAAAAFIIAASVLIIACPCAMGLATPAAIMAAANAAAARGILIRDGVALEKAGRITTVVFDKTGTLTAGTPSVVARWKSGELNADVAALAAALAHSSTHPISRAVAACSMAAVPTNRPIAGPYELAGWREVHGAGIEAEVIMALPGRAGLKVVARLGSLRWLRACGVATGAAAGFEAARAARGDTLVGLAKGDALLEVFAVEDAVKPGAAAVVRQLQEQGLRVCMVTGDVPRTAVSLAQQAGIPADHVFAEVPPDQKAAFVQRLQQAGARVAFVGDGINDAPALEQADLGIAVGRASDIAREAADIVLLKSDIGAVSEALGLARAALRAIKQNLFWAFFYNALGIPLAALGYLGPVVCAAAMGASDLVVLGNALRLRHWRADRWRTPTGKGA